MDYDNKKRTKKIKKKKSSMELKDTWNMIDAFESQQVECVYEKNNIMETNVCTSCGERLYHGDQGFLSCTNSSCGILYKEMIDFGAEWRYYGADDNNATDPTRCGMPINPLLVESSYGCKVQCSKSASYEMRKIKRYTEWQSMPYKEKSKYDDFQLITLIAKNAGIPKIIIDDAIRYYDKLSDAKTFRGLNRDGILAASIYISFSINRNPRTSREIATIFHLDNTSATKGCKNAINILNDLEQHMESNDMTVLTKSTPCTFIARYCSKLNINQELTKLCLFVAKLVEVHKFIPENTPHSIAAGIVYYISNQCNLNINKRDIHMISQISEVTINKCCKKLEKFNDRLLPKTVLEKYNIH
jgi:transcription initiation factor TFIIB|tara:strand:+ start:809 stop:1882 length:1074 start_codon:yes stop_codon:yes gene_type:complete